MFLQTIEMENQVDIVVIDITSFRLVYHMPYFDGITTPK